MGSTAFSPHFFTDAIRALDNKVGRKVFFAVLVHRGGNEHRTGAVSQGLAHLYHMPPQPFQNHNIGHDYLVLAGIAKADSKEPVFTVTAGELLLFLGFHVLRGIDPLADCFKESLRALESVGVHHEISPPCSAVERARNAQNVIHDGNILL